MMDKTCMYYLNIANILLLTSYFEILKFKFTKLYIYFQ